ncbi:hypothetical protein GN956_G24033 [Arapaima gigas]
MRGHQTPPGSRALLENRYLSELQGMDLRLFYKENSPWLFLGVHSFALRTSPALCHILGKNIEQTSMQLFAIQALARAWLTAARGADSGSATQKAMLPPTLRACPEVAALLSSPSFSRGSPTRHLFQLLHGILAQVPLMVYGRRVWGFQYDSLAHRQGPAWRMTYNNTCFCATSFHTFKMCI